MSHEAGHEFYRVAHAFRTWAAQDPTDACSENLDAIRHLIALYSAAMALDPRPECGEEIAKPDPTEDARWPAARQHFEALPLGYYLTMFNPLAQIGDEPGVGDLIDDLGDIYRDVVTGILLWEQGHQLEAVWHWRFHFNVHWGEHAVCALRALHAWAAEHGGWTK